MEKEYDEAEYQRLNNEKASNEQQQAACQNEIDAIDEKIERLREVYNIIDDAKEAIDETQINQKNKISVGLYQSLWTGSKAQYFYDLCESGELLTSYSGYVNNIDDVEDAINWEINELEEKKNEKYGILSGLANAWDDLCTKIRNFFN